jgi:hypothetical protein
MPAIELPGLRKDISVSDTPSTNVSRATILFVVLLLALGALVLASNNISTDSTLRPGDTEFVFWKSADGYISLLHPKDWQAQQIPETEPAFSYQFQSPDRDTHTPAALIKITIRRDNRPLDDQVKASLDRFSPEVQKSKTSRPVTIGKYSGVASHILVPGSGRSGEPSFELETWQVPISKDYTLHIDTLAINFIPAKPLFERMLQSIEFNPEALIAELDTKTTVQPSGAATSEPTSEPTLEPTAAAAS